jgi:hypothetical protein
MMTTEPTRPAAGLAGLAFLLALAAGGASCAPVSRVGDRGVGAPRPPTSSGAASLRFDDHLAFGLRLDSLAVRVDGRPVYRGTDAVHVPVPKELGTVALLPGVHEVSVVARVSMACGLLEEPRTAVTLRFANNFRLGQAPAWIRVDLVARAPIAKPTELAAVEFHGQGVALGLKETPDASQPVHPTCAGLEPVAIATCDVEASLAEARATRDEQALSCSSARLEEIRRMRDVLDEATDVTGGDRTTNELAMHAQLRARYAEVRIGQLAAETRRCMGDLDVADAQPAAPLCPPGILTALGPTD